MSLMHRPILRLFCRGQYGGGAVAAVILELRTTMNAWDFVKANGIGRLAWILNFYMLRSVIGNGMPIF
jgi:hypothetical protein